MRKAQASIYIIIGIALVLFLIVVLSTRKIDKKNSVELSLDVVNLKAYFQECIRTSVIDTNIKFGLHESTRTDYQTYASSAIKNCVSGYLDQLKEKGIDVIDAEIQVSLQINDNNAIVDVKYPITIKTEGFSYTYEGYTQTFDKIMTFEPQEIVGENVISEDNNFVLSADELIVLKDIKGKPAKETYIKIADKRDVNGTELVGNLAYGIFPLGYFSQKPIKIRIYLDQFTSGDIKKLRIAWQNPLTGTWAYLSDTEFENGYLEAEVYYTSYYGVTQEKPLPPGVPVLDTSSNMYPGQSEFIPQGTQGFLSDASDSSIPAENTISSPPEFNYEMIDNNDATQIFNEIKEDMGGTYDLSLRPECVPDGAFCFVGATKNCGPAQVYRKDRITCLPPEDQNILFRHEITHNLQQNNNGCASDAYAFKEWGPEYYSGSQYYLFIMEDEKKLTAQDAADLMLTRSGCTEQMLKDAAFCVPGAVERMQANCLKPNELTEHGDSGVPEKKC